MSDLVQQFLDFLSGAGFSPAKSPSVRDGMNGVWVQAHDDRAGKKSLSLTFKIEKDRAWGRFYSAKSGVGDSWYSKSDRKWTAEEKAAWKARREADDAALAAERDAGYADGAKIAQETWAAAKPCDSHSYLTRKNIKAHGARISGDELVIPMFGADGKISSVQTISSDGDKTYQWKGKKGYYPLAAKDDHTDVIYLAEGFATAATIREAINLPVMCAFDAQNLKPVAKLMKKKYPKSRIIICADTDRGKKNSKGEDFNPGIEAAMQAAGAVSGFVIAPEFSDDETSSDFNDLAALRGIDAVRNRILSVPQVRTDEAAGEPWASVAHSPGGDLVTLEDFEAQQAPAYLYDSVSQEIPLDYATEYDPAPKANRVAIKNSPVWEDGQIKKVMLWKKPPDENGPGKKEPNSMHNLMTYIRHHHALNGVFRLDSFSGKIIVYKAPPWELSDNFKIRDSDDLDTTRLIAWLENTARLMPGVERTEAALHAVAQENCIDPPLDYLDNLEWDKIPRLYKLFIHYFGANTQPVELLHALAKMWLIGGVARQFRPGCKLDNIIVLEGFGGAKKSTALEILSTINGEKYFSDAMNFKDLKSANSVMISKGKLILEFQELSGLNPQRIDDIITWLSIKTDECRVPYARTPQQFHRRFIVAGTTNNDIYLPAHGGIRRFWGVRCGEQIDCAGLAKDCHQLWAEAVWLYKNGEKWWIDHDDPIRRLVENEQKLRISERALTQPVLDYLADFNPSQITSSKIISGLGITNSQRSAEMLKEINCVLKENGWIATTARIDGKPTRCWNNPAFVTDSEIVDDGEEIKF